MTFGYECRPSFWQKVRSNSHLVIAAIGTVSFLGVAGVALWLAIPSIERPAFASPSPSQDTGTQQASLVEPSIVAATTQDAKPAIAQAVPASDDVTGKIATAAANSAPELASSPETALQAVNAQAGSALPAETSNAQIAAFAAANRAEVNGDAPAGPDTAQTAAVPTPKPAKPAAKAAKADQPQTASVADGAGTQGHILRGVTLRSGPKKGAAAIGTVPAKTAVQIFTCNQWCEITYNGKRGWVYKSFVARN